MKNKLNVILLVAVFLLAVHSIYLSLRLSAISEEAEIGRENNSGQYVYPRPVDRSTPLTSDNARVVTVDYDPDDEPKEEER